jgi:hypothetical protein
MARWEQNAASAKYLAPVGHPFTQAWHLMQMPLQTVGSSFGIDPIGHRAAHSLHRAHFRGSVSGFAFKKHAGSPSSPSGV